jgi:hypothetical protein
MSAYSSLVLASSPRAYYRLGELSGPVAHDSSGNGYDGILHGAVSLLQQNAIITDYTDYAMAFTAASNGLSGGYIGLPTGLKTDGLAALSVECWLYLTSHAYTYFPFLLCNDSNPGSSHVGFRFDLTPTTNGYIGDWIVGNGTTGPSKSFGTGQMIATNAWNHLVGVYDGTQLLTYINGYVDGTSSNPALTGTVGTATHALNVATGPTASANFLSGTLDEVAIYPSALSAATILSHYQTGNFGRTGITFFPNLVRRGS